MNAFLQFIYDLFFARNYWVTAYDHNDVFCGAWYHGGWTMFFDGQYYTYPEAKKVAEAISYEDHHTVVVQRAFPMKKYNYE